MNRIIKLLIHAAILIQLTSCDFQNNDASVSASDTEKRGIKIPDVIRNATVLHSDNLKGYVIVDGSVENRKALIPNQAFTEFTLTIDDLSIGAHTFEIGFEYEHADFGLIDLTTSNLLSKELVAGNNAFSDNDFIHTETNDNKDSDSNLTDLLATIPVDPRRCILGTSELQDLNATLPIKGCRLEILASTL